MTKTILVSLAVVTLSTSVALAAQHRIHHRNAMNAHAAMGASPVVGTGGMRGGDQAKYMQNLRDSGYDRKKDFNSSGHIATQ
jgi:hypothetical protein